MFKIAVFISGSGSNLKAIIDAVEKGDLQIEIAQVIADRDCPGLEHARQANIPYVMISRKLADFAERLNEALLDVDLIVLAGFLSVIPENLLQRFPQKMINLHPSLLPKFGGMGMYGMNVHRAVIAAGESESGCSVHFVEQEVDAGAVIAQAKVQVFPDDTPEELAKRVQTEEHQLLLNCIKKLAQ